MIYHNLCYEVEVKRLLFKYISFSAPLCNSFAQISDYKCHRDFSISLSFPLLPVYAHVISGIAVVEMQTRLGLVK